MVSLYGWRADRRLRSAALSRGISPPDVRLMIESELLRRAPSKTLTLPAILMVALRAADREDAPKAVENRPPAAWILGQKPEALGLTPDASIAVRAFHQVRLLGAEIEQSQDLDRLFVCIPIF